VSGYERERFLFMDDFSGRDAPPTVIAEAGVEAAEISYRGLFEIARDGIIILDVQTRRIIEANPYFCRLLEYSRQELIGKELWEIGVFKDKELSRAAFRELVQNKYIRHESLPLETKDGHLREVEFIGQVYEQNGQQAALCIIRDITERKQLQKDKYFLASIIESLDQSIVSVDFDNIITSWNKGAERLYGYTAKEAIGQPLTMLTLPEDLREVLANIDKVKRGERVEIYEMERIHKDGNPLYLSIMLSPVKDAHGRIIGASTSARDISNLRTEIQRRKKIEADRQLLLEQVIKAQEQERSYISRELHDSLGQQLTALRLVIENAQDLSVEGLEKLREMIKQLDEDVDFLARELRPAALDYFGLITALRTFVQDWARHFGIAAEFEMVGLNDERFTPEVEINLYRIAQEALNNIAKHAQAAQAGIILQKEVGSLAMIIEDNGVGFTLGASPDSNGRRLGLVGMRERAALIGGTFEIESGPENGTTVFVRVPLSAE
jgi:PAS domain S-box-containing protein